MDYKMIRTCHCSDRQQTQQQTLVNKYKNDAFWKVSSLNRLLLNTLQEKGNASQMALLSSPNELSSFCEQTQAHTLTVLVLNDVLRHVNRFHREHHPADPHLR